MGEILDLAEALWTGKTNAYAAHPFGLPRGIEQIADRTWFYRGFANTIIRETDDGLIVIDPAASWDTKIKFDAIRGVTQARLHTAIFTHGHTDHVFGVPEYAAEAKAKGWPLPRIVAHEAMPARFDRYRASAPWNAWINLCQFRGGVGEPLFPENYDYPDLTYADRTTVNVGGVTAELTHARGETDDHTYIFFPDNGLLCTGDLFIWSVPNAGNPQKVQRYARDWAKALRDMAGLKPRMLTPGHGVPIVGTERVSQALNDTAALLEALHENTLALMNQGATLDEIIHQVQAPAELLNKPYLQPVYDEPEFIVRNIYRFYGGWHDGAPSHLKPVADKELAEEMAALAGGAERLADRAAELSASGDRRLACHLVEWALDAAPENGRIKEMAGEVYIDRAEVETSTMAVGIFLAAARALGLNPETRLPGKTVVHVQEERAKREKAG